MVSSQDTTDILIVGAGIPGLTMALALAQHDYSVIVVDSGKPPVKSNQTLDGFDSRIYALNENSIQLLKNLGVWFDCDQRRLQPIKEMRVFGDQMATLTFNTQNTVDSVDLLGVIIEGREILQALYRKSSQHGRIQHLFGVQVETLESDQSYRRVVLNNGRIIQAQLVIAADGLHSSTRSLMGITEKIKPYDHAAIVANYQSDLDHNGVAKQWFLANGDIIALLPLPEKKLSLVWSTKPDNAAYLKSLSERQRVNELIQQVGFGVGYLEEITSPHVFPLQLMQVKETYVNRGLLCGDAAHGVHPMAGQGLNLGFADVSTFIDIVQQAKMKIDVGDDSILRRYSRRRKESVLLMQWLTDSLYKGFHLQQPWAIWARNKGMNLIEGLPVVKKLLLKQARHA